MKSYVSIDAEGVPYIQRGDYILRLDLEDLDDDYKERSRKELRETPEVVQNAVEELVKLIQDEEGLSLPVDDISHLNKFLRPCKFYPESAFKLMQKYYKFIAKNPKFGEDLMPSTVERVFNKEIIEFLPLRYKGRRIMMINIRYWDPKEVGIHLLFKSVIMALEIAMIEPRTQVAGVHVILDVAGLTMSHIFQINPMLAKVIIDFIQECLPVRLKGIHIVNQPIIFNIGYGIFKPFIGEKLKRRLFFHGQKWEQLNEHIELDFLPPIYGGTLDIPPAPGSLLVEVLKHYEGEYAKLSELGYVKK